MRILKNRLLIILMCFLFSACSTIWEKDNTPPPSALVQFTPKIRPQQIWDARINFGINREDIKFNPAMTHDSIIIVDQSGTITALNKNNGRTLWKTQVIHAAVNTGVGINDQLIVIGTKNGGVIALDARDRKPLWKAHVNSEILTTPLITSHFVIIKSIDGKIAAFSNQDGHLVWRHQETEPNLILRGASLPQLSSESIVVGYASGKIQKLSLRDGHEWWTQTIALAQGAFAIQRMIDIDADPIISGDQIFAATYQGKIAKLNLASGRLIWDHDISSYTGIAVDEKHVYVSDAQSHIWAFDRDNGRVVWKQTQLEARNITAPVMVAHYLIVGDGQGVLHWLNTEDGSFVGREQIGRAILTKPIAENNTVYAITKDGYLSAYRVD